VVYRNGELLVNECFAEIRARVTVWKQDKVTWFN
jgi:hypothetical protein